MAGETNLTVLLENMEPVLNPGAYVFCKTTHLNRIPDIDQLLFIFRETEAITIVLEKSIADQWNLEYDYIASWITLNIHSALEAVGLTAAFADALKQENISCNVVAAYFHDHIFVNQNDAVKAIEALKKLSIKK
ncbi:ACT domain-containing protein [Flavobacterium cerinum]|uniref:ACT domain-containing protein n=1 Tax=Flavobacterium cerinum TaxID=2502784 RepID=A0ABY5IV10_9FLAO|nr:ACT domain-containing protein [Flavobacterium cerinum]UUC45169.1 ACT domain-containing protein [Flavobacterium cerinum]